MKTQKNGTIKTGITLLLILAMAMSLIVIGSAAPWSNHSTIPTETRNTASFQINAVDRTVTFGQTASWTNKNNGKAAVNLSFDGAEYVKKAIKGYDFALIMDPSGSPDQTDLTNGAIAFVDSVWAQNPDARFTVIWDNGKLPSLGGYTSDRTAVVSWISTTAYWLTGNDMIQPACHKAYDMHRETGRDNPLMFIVIGDGDFGYRPLAWQNGFSFEADYKGDHYKVSMTGNPNTITWTGDMTYGGYTYSDLGLGSGETWGAPYMTYNILKNGQIISMGNNILNACFSQILYLHKFRNELWPDTLIATICIPKNGFASYDATVAGIPQCVKGRWAADEGFNFEISQNNNVGYEDAFSEMETAIQTKIATMSTTIDNRYFTVDETALEAGLPTGCTYVIQNATRGGVAVQDVEITYEMDGDQTLAVSVSVPVTINADIPASAFGQAKHLPVVYDGTAVYGAAGCSFTDLNGTAQDIHTKQVYIDASDFAPEGYDAALFEATGENVILRGDWAEESSGDVAFWVSYDGVPITQDHLNAITFTCAPALHWENVSKVFHAKGTAVLTGATNGNFAQVKVPVSVTASGVSAITINFEGAELATGYVITPGDVTDLRGTINASDQGAMTRVVNNVPGTVIPQKGLANNFDFEMMDMNKDNLLNASDLGVLSRIVNQLYAI